MKARTAWTILGVGVLAHNLTAERGEMLSEGCDRAIEKHPLLTSAAIGAVALHLVNALPERYDVIHQGFELLKSLVEQSETVVAPVLPAVEQSQ